MKISIIIPVYNPGKYLKTCVDSLLDQTYPLLEIILVDDGSIDGSAAVCDKYAELDDRVVVIHKKNGGVSSARNVGIKCATGKFVTFVDSDDWLEKDAVETAVEYLKNEVQVDMLIYAMVIDRHQKDVVVRCDEKKIDRKLYLDRQSLKEQFAHLYRNDYLSSSCTKFFSLDVVRSHNLLFDTSLVCYEDFSFVCSFLDCSSSFIALPDVKYHYRMDMDVVAINKRSQKDLQRNFHTVVSGLLQFSDRLWGKEMIPSSLWNIAYELYLNVFYKIFVEVPPLSERKKYQKIDELLQDDLFIFSASRMELHAGILTFYGMLNFAVRHRMSLLIYLLYRRFYH